MAKTKYEKNRQTRIKNLEKARKVFFDLERSCLGSRDYYHSIPRGYQPYFLILSYAVAKLDSLGEERLLELERDDTVHRSTISGASLLVARSCVEDYVGGKREFTKDNYEQLGRACYSASNIIQKRIIK